MAVSRELLGDRSPEWNICRRVVLVCMENSATSSTDVMGNLEAGACSEPVGPRTRFREAAALLPAPAAAPVMAQDECRWRGVVAGEEEEDDSTLVVVMGAGDDSMASPVSERASE